MKSFKNKTVIVTGSSKGIGKAIAFVFLKHGANVVINARNKEQLYATKEEFKNKGYHPLAIVGDITKPQNCKRLVDTTTEQFGRVDYLINNAGLSMRGRFENINAEFFKSIVDANLMSGVYCTQAARPAIRETQWSIIFVSTIASIHGQPNMSPYCVAKIGLTALAQSLRIELAKSKVHIGLLRVGFVRNYPDKKVLYPDGSYVSIKRKGHQTAEEVACAVLKMIRKKRFMMTLTLLGKTTSFLQCLFPGLVYRVLCKTQHSKWFE